MKPLDRVRELLAACTPQARAAASYAYFGDLPLGGDLGRYHRPAPRLRRARAFQLPHGEGGPHRTVPR